MSAWLLHPRLPLHLAALALALCLPALAGGWQADDYFHRAALSGQVETGHGPLELFSVMRHGPQVTREYVEVGVLPWWTSERWRLAFMRQLSAATHWLDYRLWPDSAVLQHAHSLLWLAAVVGVAALLYRRLAGAGLVAGLAALLYAVDDAHGAVAGWLANRNALVATLFGLLCLLAHDRWRRGGGRGTAALAAACLALGLAAGETALGAVAYLIAYAAVLEPGGWGRRLASLAPYAVVVAGWAALYRRLGFGAAGSGLYVDPAGEPLEFAARLIERAPFLIAGQLTPLPAELGLLAPAEHAAAIRWLMLAVAVGLMALFAPLVARRRRARFWALGAVLAVVPQCATFPANRMLLFVGLGGMGLVAEWLVEARRRKPGPGVARRLAAYGLVATHLVLAPLLLPLNALAFRLYGEPVTEAILSLPGGLGGRELIVVNAPDYLGYVSQVGAVLVAHDRAPPERIRGLAIGPSAVAVGRVDDRTLDLTMERGFLSGPLGYLFRDADEPFAVGQRFEVAGMEATVRELTAGGAPATVRFRFAAPLDAGGRLWVRFDEGRFEPFTPPVAGEPARLPAARGPFERFGQR